MVVLFMGGLVVMGIFSQDKDDVHKLLAKVERRAGSASLEWLQKDLFVTEDFEDYQIKKSEEEWKKLLSPTQYEVLRNKGTERAYSNPLHSNKQKGMYYSAATNQPLFSSEHKYDSMTGWPSFWQPVNPDAVRYVIDKKFGWTRIEVVDSLSGSHLGHVFEDGPPPTGLRYCMNAEALVFIPTE